MARIVITRPNGDVEYAELTEDKTLAGDDRLTVEKDGKTYYGKLAPELSTHMYVIKPDGRKLYVQKEIAFKWIYTFENSENKAKAMVIPRTGKYKLTFEDIDYWGEEGRYKRSHIKTEYAVFSTGTTFNTHYHIKDITGKDYVLIYETDNGIDPDNPEYEANTVWLISIEYIGNA